MAPRSPHPRLRVASVPRAVQPGALAVTMVLAMALVVAPTPAVAAQDSTEDAAENPTPHVETQLVTDRRAVHPGDTIPFGISFDIDPGWHLYWRGYSDSGQPIDVTFELPDGVQLSPLRWPAPSHLASDGMLDLVYEGQVTLVAELTVSADVEPGARLVIDAHHEWLVCRELCLFGAGQVSLALPVVPQDQEVEVDESGALRMDRTAVRLPRTPRAAIDDRPGEVSVSWDDTRARIVAPGASRLLFHPNEDCGYPADLLNQGEVSGDTLDLDLIVTSAAPLRLSGILEVHRPDHPRADFLSVLEIRP